MFSKDWKDSFNRELLLKGRKKKTIRNYNSFYDKFVLKFENEHHPKHISAKDIKDYLITIDSPSEFKQMLSVVKFFYKYVVKQPEKLDDIQYRKVNSKLPEILTKEEVLRRIGKVKDIRYKAIFMLIYKTGLRVTECASLKLLYFNKSRKIITIREGKGGKDRNVPYGESVRQALIPYFRIRKNSAWVFHGENPLNYISTSIIEKRCREFLDMHPHQLRHCFSVHYLEAGGDIYTLQRILGHSKVETTERYARMTDTLLMNALELIEEAA